MQVRQFRIASVDDHDFTKRWNRVLLRHEADFVARDEFYPDRFIEFLTVRGDFAFHPTPPN